MQNNIKLLSRSRHSAVTQKQLVVFPSTYLIPQKPRTSSEPVISLVPCFIHFYCVSVHCFCSMFLLFSQPILFSATPSERGGTSIPSRLDSPLSDSTPYSIQGWQDLSTLPAHKIHKNVQMHMYSWSNHWILYMSCKTTSFEQWHQGYINDHWFSSKIMAKLCMIQS